MDVKICAIIYDHSDRGNVNLEVHIFCPYPRSLQLLFIVALQLQVLFYVDTKYKLSNLAKEF